VPTTALEPIGVEVTGLDLATADDARIDELRTLLAEHGVVVVPGQEGLGDDGLAALRGRIGDALAATAPERGGEALFGDRYRAYETLSSDIRMHLAGRTVTDGAGVEHPLFRRHPDTGRTALHLAAPKRGVEISGMDGGASRTTIGFLYEHATAADTAYRHTWSPGDVVLWDHDRVLHRETVVAP
jgi:taurine dioxygenase